MMRLVVVLKEDTIRGELLNEIASDGLDDVRSLISRSNSTASCALRCVACCNMTHKNNCRQHTTGLLPYIRPLEGATIHE